MGYCSMELFPGSARPAIGSVEPGDPNYDAINLRIDEVSQNVTAARARANEAFEASTDYRNTTDENINELGAQYLATRTYVDEALAGSEQSLIEIGQQFSASFMGQVDGFNNRFNQVSSQYTALSTSLADGLGAHSSQISSLDASFNDFNSAFTSYRDAQATASGAMATAFENLQSSFGDVNSQVSILAETISELEGGRAGFSVLVNAGEDHPALLGLSSTVYGSTARISADQIWFGSNTVFDNETDTFITTKSGRRYMDGAGFGANDDLLMWVGLDSVTAGSETTGNALFAISLSGAFINGDRPPFTAEPEAPFLIAFGGGGLPGSAIARVNPRGGIGPFTYDWRVASGVDLNITNADQQECTIIGTGELGRASVICIVHDQGAGTFAQAHFSVMMDDIGGGF